MMIDALIVQDVGMARLSMEVVPMLEVHASTQQTVTSANSVAFAAHFLGATRVILGRELSVSEIESVISDAAEEILEVEVFVCRALCISYNGQCFSSEAWGDHSANWGKCKQACQLSYRLILDGEIHNLQDISWLVLV
eukprot:15365234-Ditylum_brightwellii.AAC.1